MNDTRANNFTTQSIINDDKNLSPLNRFISNNLAYFENSLYVLYLLIFLFGVIGNSIVIYVLMSSLFLGNRNNKYQSPVSGVGGGGGGGGGGGINPSNARNMSMARQSIVKLQQNNNSFRHLVKMENGNASPVVKNAAYLLVEDDKNDVTVAGVANKKTLIQSYNAETKNYNQNLVMGSDGLQNQSSTSLSDSFGESAGKRCSAQLMDFMRKLIVGKLTVTNFYLLNLAISDFFYSLFIPFLLITVYSEQWLFGSLFCKIYFSFVYLCQCSSVFILVVLSIDRYLSVKYPLKVAAFRSDEIARIVMFFSWLLTFLFILPVIFYTEIKHDQMGTNTTTCVIHWPDSWNFKNQTYLTNVINAYFTPFHAFNVYTFLLNYLIPVTIIVILYTQILNRLNKKTQLNANKSKMSKTKKKSLKKINKMVLTIVICYIVCWTPYWCYQVFNYIYQHTLKNPNTHFLVIISHFVQVIAYMSSALNPFIYSYMSEAFRSNFKLVIESCGVFRVCVKQEPLDGNEEIPLNNNVNFIVNDLTKQRADKSYSALVHDVKSANHSKRSVKNEQHQDNVSVESMFSIDRDEDSGPRANKQGSEAYPTTSLSIPNEFSGVDSSSCSNHDPPQQQKQPPTHNIIDCDEIIRVGNKQAHDRTENSSPVNTTASTTLADNVSSKKASKNDLHLLANHDHSNTKVTNMTPKSRSTSCKKLMLNSKLAFEINFHGIPNLKLPNKATKSLERV